LKIIADFKPGKRRPDIGCENGILSTTARTTIYDKRKYKCIAKLAVPGKVNV
jgi:hypothetical protein